MGIMTGPGVIDRGYTGPIKIMFFNMGFKELHIRKGDQCAQIIFPHITTNLDVKIVAELPQTQRGNKGFGSSTKPVTVVERRYTRPFLTEREERHFQKMEDCDIPAERCPHNQPIFSAEQMGECYSCLSILAQRCGDAEIMEAKRTRQQAAQERFEKSKPTSKPIS